MQRQRLTREEELNKQDDPASMFMLASFYYHGIGVQQDRRKAIELYARAAHLGFGDAHCQLAHFYDDGGHLKKAKFHHPS